MIVKCLNCIIIQILYNFRIREFECLLSVSHAGSACTFCSKEFHWIHQISTNEFPCDKSESEAVRKINIQITNMKIVFFSVCRTNWIWKLLVSCFIKCIWMIACYLASTTCVFCVIFGKFRLFGPVTSPTPGRVWFYL